MIDMERLSVWIIDNNKEWEEMMKPSTEEEKQQLKDDLEFYLRHNKK